MANNIKGNAPNAVVAKSTVSFASAGITSVNTEIIYLVDNPLKSYVPGRAINGISGFESGKGYYMVAKVDMDLEAVLIPPISGGTSQLGAPGSFSASAVASDQINLSWGAVTNATGYVLQRATDAGFTTALTTLVNGSNVTSFNDTGRTASTQYYYRVKAVASGYTDSNYSTANATTLSSGGSTTNLTFGTATGISASGTEFTGTGTAYSNQYALADQKLPASTDGHIVADFINGTNESALLAFNLQEDSTYYNGPTNGGYEYFLWAYSGNYYRGYDGGNVTSLAAAVAGDKYRLIRTGGVIKAQYYRSGTWTDLFTYPTNTTAQLFININMGATGAKVSNPVGANVVAR